MNQMLLGLLAETFVHAGAGQTGGAIDLPVAREAATGYPFIAGSGMKGALRAAVRLDEDGQTRVFGTEDRAGALLVSDARLLLLPLRSLSSSYRWATCPHLLERFARDLRRTGTGIAPADTPTVDRYRYLDAATQQDTKLFLEERSFAAPSPSSGDGPNLDGWITSISGLIHDTAARGRLRRQLTVLNDCDFAWFARHGLPVQARNQLSERKTSENLWYEETLPPDTLMYTTLAEHDSDSGGLAAMRTAFEHRPYLQVGGNETVGQGWFAVACSEADA